MYFILLCLNSLASTGQILINVILPKYLIDELIGNRVETKLLLLGAGVVLSNVFFAFFTLTMKRLMAIKNIYMNEKMNQAMAAKIMNVEFSYLENPYYLDLKERAVFAANNQSALENLINNVADSLKNLFTIVSLLAVMFTLSPIFVILLAATIGITLLLQRFFVKYQMQFFQDVIPINRKYGYYVGLAYNDKLQKDIRLFHMGDMLTDRVSEYNNEINNWFTAYHKKQGLFLSLYGIINDLQAAISYGYVGLRVISNVFGTRIGIGSFTMYVSAAVNFTTATTAFGKNIMTVIQMLGYLEPFMEFMALPDEEKQDGTISFSGEIETLSFEKVTFTYPGSTTPVLKGISFQIKKGEKISIVGINGAGKSTIVKLLCRLYRPTSGKIYINGRDIYEYEFSSYMKSVAAVFQDYKLFAFSIHENIAGVAREKDRNHVMELLNQVGLQEKIDTLSQGADSLFGKSYDENGIEISGGEGQKVAIARALYKKAGLIILDEPTSALDPLAEAEIYEKFNQLVGDKTALYISHRMSSSVFCDKILVLDKGVISDFDTHKKLMENKDSMYYKLFNSQAVNYQS
jgi:ABC-type multidrug transport system fused ATPase/permease subunit